MTDLLNLEVFDDSR